MIRIPCAALALSASAAVAEEPPPPVADIAVAADGVWRLPGAVRALRVLDDGTWLLAGTGALDCAKARFVSSDPVVEALGTEAFPSRIDGDGNLWYSWLNEARRTNWVRQTATRLELIEGRSAFRARPEEFPAGTVWLRTDTGYSFLRKDGLRHVRGRPGEWWLRPGPRGDALLHSASGGDLLYFAPGADQPQRHNQGMAGSLAQVVGARQWLLYESGRHARLFHAPGHRMPEALRADVLALGAPGHREREAAQARLTERALAWEDRLRLLRDQAADPEIRERLAEVLSGWESAGNPTLDPTLALSDGTWPEWPPNERLRSPENGRVHLILQHHVPEDPRTERFTAPDWRWAAIDADGSHHLIADRIAARLRPTDLPPPGGAAGWDVVPLADGVWAYRGSGDRLRVYDRGRGVLQTAGDDRPNESCALFGTWQGWILARRWGVVHLLPPSWWRDAAPMPAWTAVKPARELRVRIRSFNNSFENPSDDLDHGKLLGECETLLRLCPDFRTGHYNRASFLLQLGRHEEAAQAYTDFIGMSGYHHVLRMRATAWTEAEQFDRALRDLNLLLDLTPRGYYARASYLLGRGNLHMKREAWRAAMADFRACLFHDDDNATAWNNIAWLLATAPIDDLRDGEEAIKFALRACELTDYERTFALDTLAAAYAEAGRWEKAEQTQKKAIALVEEGDEEQELFDRHLKKIQNRQPLRLPGDE